MSDGLRRAYKFSVVPEALTHDLSVDDRAFRLWCVLDRRAGAANASMPTRGELGEALGCSRASIDRSIGKLIAAGWLTRESRRDTGDTSIYTLSDNPSEGCVTDDAPSPVEQGHLTGDAPGDSPVEQGRVTGDAHIRKET